MTTETTTRPRFTALDRAIIQKAQARFNQGEAHAIEDALNHMGFARFMRAAPADMKAELTTAIAQAGEKQRAARQKARSKAKPVRTARTRPVAQVAPSGPPEGAAELAATIKRNAELLNGPNAKPKSDKMSADEISAMWAEAHERVARDTGRIR